uniref:Uncharacterized protein n=1 Tax=Anguilla anguilla TaxID=7936 RepID=A0A0E9VT71_ANGAN
MTSNVAVIAQLGISKEMKKNFIDIFIFRCGLIQTLNKLTTTDLIPFSGV